MIGWPISQSKSPLIHGHWIQKFDLDASYDAIAIKPENFETSIQDLIDDGFRGANVTIPHKEAAFQICNQRSDRAEKIGAVNTLVFRDGIIHGDNTDGIGFYNNIKSSLPNWDPSTGPSAVLGAGGAARAILWALINGGCREIRLWNRTKSRADQLAEEFGSSVLPVASTEEAIQNADFLVNTTSLGMTGQPPLQVDISGLASYAVVTDIVYAPLKTDLLIKAESNGHPVVDGLGMLLHQAVPGFEAWFGKTPKVTQELREMILA